MTPGEQRVFEGRFCKDCGVDTFEINEYYMVTKDLWRQYGVKRGMLCIACLEKRMGRSLTLDDFTDCILNRVMYLPKFPGRHRSVSDPS
jgi:hypothetical protein